MTENQVKWLTAALKANGAAGFERPHQCSILKAGMVEMGKLTGEKADEILVACGFALNASAQLGDMKRDGLIQEAMTDAAKAKRSALLKALGSNS
jgi:hypothetical protein